MIYFEENVDLDKNKENHIQMANWLSVKALYLNPSGSKAPIFQEN